MPPDKRDESRDGDLNLNAGTFAGFPRQTQAFLRELAANNHKGWFETHREDYVRLLHDPLRHLAVALSEPLLAIDPGLVTQPGKVVSRIHRDVRFSRDKSPYKTTMWLTFKRPVKDWQDAPAFFFEIGPASWRYGMGYYDASRATMDRVRRVIETRPGKFRQAVAFLKNQERFVVEGESYRRSLHEGLPEDLSSWHQRKSFYVACNRNISGVLVRPGLANELAAGFGFLAPFYRWLWKLKEGAS